MVLGELHQSPLSKTCPWCSQVSYLCFNGRLELLGRIKIKNDDMQLSILNLVEKTAQTFEHSWLVHGTRRGKPKGCLKQCAMDQWSQHSSMTWISNISTWINLYCHVFRTVTKDSNSCYVWHSLQISMGKVCQV
jgi:hypothetical protein